MEFEIVSRRNALPKEGKDHQKTNRRQPDAMRDGNFIQSCLCESARADRSCPSTRGCNSIAFENSSKINQAEIIQNGGWARLVASRWNRPPKGDGVAPETGCRRRPFGLLGELSVISYQLSAFRPFKYAAPSSHGVHPGRGIALVPTSGEKRLGTGNRREGLKAECWRLLRRIPLPVQLGQKFFFFQHAAGAH